MFLSLLLSVVTLNPAVAPPMHAGFTTGVIQADRFSPDKVCKPGDICGSKKTSLKGCFFNNLWKNGSYGATPLTVDVTETPGKTTWVYWVNTTNTNLTVMGAPSANYYCPPS